MNRHLSLAKFVSRLVREPPIFGQVAKVYSKGKRRHGNGSKEAQILDRIQEESGAGGIAGAGH